MDTRIELDFDGIIFRVPKNILVQAGYFRNLFDDCSNETSLIVPRSGMIFEHVLALLRNPNYNFPPKHYEELDFYQIDTYQDMVVVDLQGRKFVLHREKLRRFTTLYKEIDGKRYLYVDRSASTFERLLNPDLILQKDYDDALYYGLLEDTGHSVLLQDRWILFHRELYNKSSYLQEIVDKKIKYIDCPSKDFDILLKYLSDDSYRVSLKYVDVFSTVYRIQVPHNRRIMKGYTKCDNTDCNCPVHVEYINKRVAICPNDFCFKSGCVEKKTHCRTYCEKHRCNYNGWGECQNIAVIDGKCKDHQ